MSIYILMFVCCFILLLLSEKIKSFKFLKFLLITVAILIPSFIAGGRALTIGTDIKVYGEYMAYVASNNPTNFFGIFGYSDILFSIFTLIICFLFKDVHIFLFFLQLVNCTIVYLACRNVKDKCPIWISFTIYLLIVYFRQLNLLRQGIALSFSIYAVSCLLNNKNKDFYLFSVIATLFHISSIILFIIPFLKKLSESFSYKKKLKISVLYIILISSFVLFFPLLKLITSLGVLSSKYTYDYFLHYLNINNEIDNLGTFFYLLWCIIILLISCKHLLKEKINDFNLWYHLSFISFILYMLNIYIKYIDRISFYFFYPVIMFFVPQIKNIFKNDLLNRIIIYMCIIGLFVFYWYIRFIYQNAGNIYPYVHY